MSDMPKKQLKVNFVVPDNLKDVYVNGAWGGTYPTGLIYMHLFSERVPTPQSVTYEQETLKQIDVKVDSDIIRVVQASLIMDLIGAEQIRNWLDDKIKAAERFMKEAENGNK